MSTKIELPLVEAEPSTSCCNDQSAPTTYFEPGAEHWVSGKMNTAAGSVYRVATTLTTKDYLGTVKTRCNLGRMNYMIPPALYAIGEPDQNAPVLVSANYKLSFDSLRRQLTGRNLWLLVIDSKGINVWCAAGKGAFGTAEILRMIGESRLKQVVPKGTLILPQLAAPGVAAHEIRRESGLKVVYGPVRAADLPVFLDASMKAEPAMRRTTFNLLDRLVLAPVELIGMGLPLLYLALFLGLLNLAALLAQSQPLTIGSFLGQIFADLFPFLIAGLIGIILVPALLPYIPGRALSWKGWLLGLIWALSYNVLINPGSGWLAQSSHLLLLPAIPAFLGLNFTGSTTYTSLSGVLKEMGIALPLIIGSAGLGLIALLFSFFI